MKFLSLLLLEEGAAHRATRSDSGCWSVGIGVGLLIYEAFSCAALRTSVLLESAMKLIHSDVNPSSWGS